MPITSPSLALAPTSPATPKVYVRFHNHFCPQSVCAAVQEAQLGIRRTTTIPVKFKQMIFDCLRATTSVRPNQHFKHLTSTTVLWYWDFCHIPCILLQEAQLGIRRTTTIPVKFKQMVSDCLSPTTSLRPSKHHKLSEVNNVDTPPARPITPLEARGAEEEEVQSQQAAGQASSKRLRVAPLVSLPAFLASFLQPFIHSFIHLFH